MKKLIIIAILLYGGYHYFSSTSPIDSFDEEGNPLTVLFTISGCRPCDDARSYLINRKINFQEYNINTGGEEANDKFRKAGGSRQFPYLISGNQSSSSFEKYSYTSLFAEQLGENVLTPIERTLLKKNFNTAGQPKLVMYSTKTCGYCVKARQLFEDESIPFTELFIDQDPKAKRHYQLLEASGTPLIYIGYRRINGFDKPLIKSTISDQLDLNI